MRYQFFFYTFLSIALPLFTSAEPHGPPHRRHSALANRKRTSLELQAFHKRTDSGRATYYDVGLGACGKTNVPSDFIVALNTCDYGSGSPGPQCFKMITIEYQGKQTQAQVMDECEACPCHNGIDMSRGLFTYFSPLDAGVISVNWWYSDGGPPAAPSPSPSPTPTSTWVPPPPTSSSVWVDPSPWTSQTTSSTWSAPSSSSSSSSSWSSSSWSSSSSSWNSSTWTSHSSTASSTPSSSSSTPTIAATPLPAQNILDVNRLFDELGTLVVQYSS